MNKEEIEQMMNFEGVEKIPNELLAITNCLFFYGYKIQGSGGRVIAEMSKDFPAKDKCVEMVRKGEKYFSILYPLMLFNIIQPFNKLLKEENYAYARKVIPRCYQNWYKLLLKIEGDSNASEKPSKTKEK